MRICTAVWPAWCLLHCGPCVHIAVGEGVGGGGGGGDDDDDNDDDDDDDDRGGDDRAAQLACR